MSTIRVEAHSFGYLGSVTLIALAPKAKLAVPYLVEVLFACSTVCSVMPPIVGDTSSGMQIDPEDVQAMVPFRGVLLHPLEEYRYFIFRGPVGPWMVCV